MDLRDRQLSEVDSPAAWRRVGFAVAVGTIGSVDTWSMPVALPFVQTDFGITRADASLPYTLAMMGFAFGGVAMGRLCDSFGVVVAIMLGSLALGGAIFLARSRDVRDGRGSEWSTGTRMVAVDVAIAHRGPRDVAGWSRVAAVGLVGGSHRVDRSRSRTAVPETSRMVDGRLPTVGG
jgi:MFS family permease